MTHEIINVRDIRDAYRSYENRSPVTGSERAVPVEDAETHQPSGDDSSRSQVVTPYNSPLSDVGGPGGSNPETSPRVAFRGGRYTFVPASHVKPTQTIWLIPGILPAGHLTVVVGDEGIGKGLFTMWAIKQVTDTGRRVLLIAPEDDPAETLAHRLQAAEVDTEKVVYPFRNPHANTGHPILPNELEALQGYVANNDVGLVVIDPWAAVLPGSLQPEKTLQARQALEPLQQLARENGVAVLVVTHTNRSGGSARDKTGLTIALRQVPRLVLHALEDPSDPDYLIVGVEKANNAGKSDSLRFRKTGQGQAWKVTDPTPTGQSVARWLELAEEGQPDGRRTERWSEVVAAADSGLITRQQIIKVYKDNDHSADKAISRWVKAGKLSRSDAPGVFEVVQG